MARPNEAILKAMSRTPVAMTYAFPNLSMFALIIGAINMYEMTYVAKIIPVQVEAIPFVSIIIGNKGLANP